MRRRHNPDAVRFDRQTRPGLHVRERLVNAGEPFTKRFRYTLGRGLGSNCPELCGRNEAIRSNDGSW